MVIEILAAENFSFFVSEMTRKVPSMYQVYVLLTPKATYEFMGIDQ